MNAIVQLLNTAGRAFIDFAVPMLIQSSLLILILLAVDAVLRKRVRAVLRYWIWMLVLVKLVLPPSLWSPVSVGTWFGDRLEVPTAALLEHVSRSSSPRPEGEMPSTQQGQARPERSRRDALATKPSPIVTSLLSRPQRPFVASPIPEPCSPAAPGWGSIPPEGGGATNSLAQPPGLSLNWQGLVLLAWGAVVAALLLLLAQRTFFVQGLVAQAEEADGAMLRALDECRRRQGLRRPISLRFSPNAASPAVCGLLRPVILVPQNLAARLHGADLQAVLYHELAHVQRGDLWINLVQTLLQIVYFYNPLLWLANTAIRRIREQAVDETVLVALGEAAPQYPETLVTVAKLAFARQPALSLRLLGVVESKSALTSRIKHILNRPIPKTARLGMAGLAMIIVIAAVLLPMAAAQDTTGSVAPDAPRDSDGDGLSNYDETQKYLTDPTKKDSDSDGIPDGDWSERREYTYSVRTVLRYLPPLDEKALSDDFQDGRVLKQTKEYIEVEVIHYPLATGYDAIAENRNWRQDDARMREYLAPGATTNWDEPMRRDLIAALKADGIDVETLSDKQVVEQVSRWLLQRSRSLDKVFTTWYIHFPQGKPAVYPGLEDAFQREFARDSGSYNWTIDQHFDHELLGKGMFYSKTHGSCTSTAVYLTTVLRALGIPTRMVLVAPAVDASDREQILMVKKALTHNRVRETMLAGLRRSSHGFTNHTLNEVYVGGRWRRLDYNQLGRPAFGVDRFGLQTHLYTLNDLSDADLASTWGRRYAQGERNDLFQHDNPYAAVEVSELFGPHGTIANPPFSAQESSSSPLPNIFVMSPGKVRVWDDVIGIVKGSTWDKTGRPHAKEYYDNLFEGIWTTKPGDILVLLFSLDTPERIPEGYEDLLPKPWPEIESQLRQGQPVELGGKARDKNVILLASPTAGGLKLLVQNSKLLKALGGSHPALAADPAQPQAVPQSAAKPVQLANGATVELLGICEYPSEGKRWWRPDGSALDVAPYQTTRNKRKLAEGFRDYELVVRYGGASHMAIEWSVPGARNTGITGSPFATDGQSIRDLTVCTVRFPQTQATADVRIGVAAGPWETQAVHRSLDREGTYSLSGGRAVAFGISHFQDGRTLVPVTTNFWSRDIDFRVVAMDEQGKVNTGGLSGFSGNNLNSLTYLFDCPLSSIKELRLQTRPWTWVEFKTVALRPGLRTEARAESAGVAAGTVVSRRASGQEKIAGIGPAWQILKEAVGPRYSGTIGGFSADAAQTRQYFEKVLSWTRPGDAFVLMLAFDRPVGVPPEYADLLPLPWTQIESRVRQGQSVETQGQARDLTVIVLAAPTSEQLNTLVRQTHLLDPFRLKTEVEVRVQAIDVSGKAAPSVGTEREKEMVLPEVDRRSVLLDLATGQLVPVPPVGPDPEKLQQALRKLGKGDLLYDCVQGDRALGLLRDATSEQAQEPAGEPSIKGHLIDSRLPEVLTIKTAEGGQYRVTILAADDTACTLRYSLISTGKGAGGGARAEPETVGSGLELRVAPTREELGANVLQEWTNALAEGRTPVGGRYLWVPVRPGTDLGPFLITQTHGNKTWLLVHNAEPFIMILAQGWRLAQVGRDTDNSGRPIVTLEFDDAGAARMLHLTQTSGGKPVAIVVGGIVVSAPMILKGQGGFSKAAIPGDFTERELEDMMASLKKTMPVPTPPPTPPQELSGRVVDPNGNPVAGAQVALCTKDKGVDIQAGQLLPTKWGGKGGAIVKTDAQGRFSFASVPDEFHLIAAHEQGFAWVTNKELAASGALRLEPWGRIEGTLRIGRELGTGERISLQRGGNRSAADQNIHLDYETYADRGGRFTFARVPPTWMEVGYLIRTGDSMSSDTSRTPIHLLPGQNLRLTLGGEGRPVIGKFVPPTGYEGPIYFGQGLRALDTVDPDLPKPANYNQMTKRKQQEWLKQWYKTAEAEAYYDARWHDLNRRHYTFRIENDGTFRIEDVIPGRYEFTVWLEERLSRPGRPEEIGAYYGTIEVPALPGGRTDEPLELGNLTVGMHNPPLHAGDMAPLFEAKTLDGKDIRLVDDRGKFVLLSFWQPVSHPELDRLRELHRTYGDAGKLAIIGLGGWDTLEEVRKYVAEHQMEWPEVYFGPGNKEGIANQYGLPGVPYILLVDPQGRIIATWLRGEKLTQTVKDALGPTK